MNNDLKIIIGLGKTGLSCIRYLARNNHNLAVIDSRANPPGLQELQKDFPKIPIYVGDFHETILQQASEIIISPGVALSEPSISSCIKQGIKVIGDIELFARDTKTPIVAITGSNGKSTVTSLVGAMIKKSGKKAGIGGNLGTPALDLLEQKADFYVLELSSFQLESTYSLQAAASVVLNISPDHMDRYHDLNEYLKAKQRIYSGCLAAIINRDDPLSYQNVTLPQKVIGFSIMQPQNEDFGFANGYLMQGNKKLVAGSSLKIKGQHNIANALAALALGHAIDLPMDKMVLALQEFPGLTHRCEWVAKINNVDWYNDSKGTNVGATKSAIEGLGSNIDGKIILIAGGQGKGADFSPLRQTIAKYARSVILIGKDAPLIAKELDDKSSKLLYGTSMQEAVAICAKEAQPQDAVLLSPACASFDMFNNFEHRGEIFIQEVKKL